MKTDLCEQLGIEAPIIQAPMSGADGPDLAAAVSEAGGLGMLALWRASLEEVSRAIRQTKALTDQPFGVNLNLNWPQEERLDACIAEGVAIVSFFWGDPAGLVARAQSKGAKVMLTVSSADEAKRAAELGVDIIVAQGWEAGGHVRGSVATMPLVPAVVDSAAPIPVVAAGGISDGRGLAAALALGASGVWIGTRFLASQEANAHPEYQRRLIAAREGGTYCSELFNIGWEAAPHRTLRNSTIDAWEAAGRPPSGSRPGEGEVLAASPAKPKILRYQSHTVDRETKGELEALSLWAGQSVGLVDSVKPAGDIVREIAADALAVIHRLS